MSGRIGQSTILIRQENQPPYEKQENRLFLWVLSRTINCSDFSGKSTELVGVGLCLVTRLVLNVSRMIWYLARESWLSFIVFYVSKFSYKNTGCSFWGSNYAPWRVRRFVGPCVHLGLFGVRPLDNRLMPSCGQLWTQPADVQKHRNIPTDLASASRA